MVEMLVIPDPFQVALFGGILARRSVNFVDALAILIDASHELSIVAVSKVLVVDAAQRAPMDVGVAIACVTAVAASATLVTDVLGCPSEVVFVVHL
jgi:hypothetical protein